MKVGVFHVDTGTQAAAEGYVCASALVRSVRKTMPKVPVVHFTDQDSKPIKGVDEVRRKQSEPMALLRMRHHASVPGEWLFVDTDVILKKDCQPVFDVDFDIAVTDRNWPHLKIAVGFTERMPFNTGVMFSRCPGFWGEIYTRLREFTADERQWMGDQAVICEIVTEDDGRYHFVHLKGHRFNYPPALPTTNRHDAEKAAEKDAWIVHYKGPDRKALMLARIHRKCA